MAYRSTLTSIFILAILLSLSGYSLSAQTRQPFFLENKGQVTDQYGNVRTDISFKLAAGNGLNVFIGKDGLCYQWTKSTASGINTPLKQNGGKRMPSSVEMYRMDVRLIGANPDPRISATGLLPYYENYYSANSGSKGFRSNAYSRVIIHDIYPDIDWTLYFSEDGKLEYDFIIRPGGNITDIRLQYGGATGLDLTPDGSLNAITALGNVHEQAPYTYQQEDGKVVKSWFQLSGNMLSLKASSYHGTLVIDPVLDWGTYFGGTDVDMAYDNVLGKDGRLYVTGGTSSTANIATVGAYQFALAGGAAYLSDAFITKFNADGQRIWSTYYGTTAEDVAKSISADTSGNLYIAGYTASSTGLSSSGAYQVAAHGGYDAFIARFDTSGQRVWGTYFGGEGDDGGYGPIALHCDRYNNLYLTGQTSSATGIATAGAYQTALYGGTGDQDAFLTKFSTSGALQWGTYFGGNFGDAAYAVTNDSLGNIYMAGNTNSASGIASTGQTTNAGSYDAFLAKFTASGTKTWSTYFGGNMDDYAIGIATDNAANIYLTGLTTSTSGLATTGAHQTTYGGGYQDAILGKFNNSGTLLWATYYGGNSEDQGDKVICAHNDRIYLSGFTGSDTGMIAGSAFQPLLGGSYDGLLARFDNNGSLIWGTYIGGADADEAFSVAADDSFNLFVAGSTSSATGIAGLGASQPAFGGGDFDGFIMRVKDCNAPNTPDTILGLSIVCAGLSNMYVVTVVSGATSYHWLLPVGWTGAGTSDTITIINNGSSGTIRVIAVNDCSISDTASLAITVNPAPSIPVIIQNGNVLSVNQVYSAYQWNKDGIPVPGAVNATYTMLGNGNYSVTVSNINGCSVTSDPVSLQLTGIGDLLAKNDITIYPNPTTSSLFINLPIKAVARISNVEGRLLMSRDLKPGINVIDLGSYSPGIYFISVNNNSGDLLGSQKIIKN